MSIKIPPATTKSTISRNLVTQMAKNGFLPVIALEAFVEAGRTYQAYKRGGFDEARERITEEFSGAVFWLGGVTALNALFEKIGQKILKLPEKVVDIASDDVRKPLINYLESETTKTGAKILEKTMAKFKFIKVISSVLIANAFIGFVLPKINQAITRSYHKNKPQPPAAPEQNSFTKLDMNNFLEKADKNKDNSNISFGLNLLAIANKFENNRNYKLLAVDAGTASGRAYSARNNDERIEILFRDLASIYFYMFNMVNMNTWLNKIEQKGNGSRLDPVSANYTNKYLEEYLKEIGSAGKDEAADINTLKINVEKFKQDMFGKEITLPESLKAKFEGKKIKIISLDAFKEELKNLVPENELKNYELIAQKMSELQPKVKGISILTQSQVKDILSGGIINNPEFLKEFFKTRFGKTFMEKYKFIAQNDLDALKNELVDYINSIIEAARKHNSNEITYKLLKKVSSNNLKWNAINWGTGFAISALFLSTLIPKMQYLITKLRTGSDNFPGTAQYRQEN